LCREEVQIRIKPGLVTDRRDIEKALRRKDGLLFLLNLLGQKAQGREVVRHNESLSPDSVVVPTIAATLSRGAMLRS
jgi:hypothetical protein